MRASEWVSEWEIVSYSEIDVRSHENGTKEQREKPQKDNENKLWASKSDSNANQIRLTFGLFIYFLVFSMCRPPPSNLCVYSFAFRLILFDNGKNRFSSWDNFIIKFKHTFC